MDTSDSRVGLTAIAAVAENGVIGFGDGRDWNLPGDLRHFRATTLGSPVVMGSVTWRIIGGALPGRTNIVLSQHGNWAPEGALLAQSIEEAVDLAIRAAMDLGSKQAFIIGGASVYQQMVPLCDRLILTIVHKNPEGELKFPTLEGSEWGETSRSVEFLSAGDSDPYHFVTYDRLR